MCVGGAVDLSIQRVAERVRGGGHDIPEAVIRRRYQRGIDNFVRRYRQQADRWWCYGNSEAVTRLVAFGSGDTVAVPEPMVWQQIQR